MRKYQKKERERELTHEASSGSILIVSVFTIKGSVTFERKIDARSIVTIELGSRVALFCIAIGKCRTREQVRTRENKRKQVRTREKGGK